ncbi:hypothetical protein GCM10027273_01770 [Nocardioides pakistanensis]
MREWEASRPPAEAAHTGLRPVMRRADSIRDQVIMLMLGMVLLVTVVAGGGAVGVTSLSDDVGVLVDDYRPAAYSNIAMRNDVAVAQSAVRGWLLSGDDQFLEKYQQSLQESQVELRHLEILLEDDAALAGLVQEQTRLVADWASYTEGLARSEPGAVSTAYLLDGDVTFERLTDANDALSEGINAAINARGDQSSARARAVIAVVALVSLLGLAVTGVLGVRMVRRVNEPLREMEDVVEQLASGNLAARAPVDGPREIRGVASALNTLAEENQRSRELEERVVSQLKALDKAKDEFVSTVSHELRTPLTSIAGYLELLEDDFADVAEPRQMQMLAVVRRNVGRLRNLIEDLLTLSRVESDAFRTTFDLVDMGHLTSDVAHDVAAIAARAGVKVRESNPGHPVVVNGDAGQLSRAMLNLVTNAIKFSPSGSQVLIRLSEFDGQAVVSVVDHGIGIPAAELATLGSRFFRASNAVEAEIGGTGLGLRIVQTIVDNHGGRLDIDSTEGLGTTVRLVVPLAGDQAHRNISAESAISSR